MCGIAGIFGSSADLRAISRMTSIQRHRGPDDEGYLAADTKTGRAVAYRGPDTVPAVALPFLPESFPAEMTLALGHRRLSIIDLTEGGHMPMASRDRRSWVTYNGEIYNYLELRAELESAGASFETSSDTEVLLAAYDRWGEDALHRFNGMFAFVLYDVARHRLFGARDRFGVKPLHYFWNGAFFAFASEIKALLAHPKIPAKPHLPTAYAFLVDGASDETEQTFFDEIRRVPAGGLFTLELDTRRLDVRRWYEIRPIEKHASARELEALLEDAVRLRLRSDVDVGTCLSGGLDSSSIVALTARLRKAALSSNGAHRSFSVVYREPGIDESPFVDSVVEATGVSSSRATPTAAELWDELPALVRHQDEPFAASGVYSQWRVMRLAREAGVKVLLDGQGADEVLAGYLYHFGPYLAEIARSKGPGEMIRQARSAARVTSKPLAFFLGLYAFHALRVPRWLRSAALARFATHASVPRNILDAAAFGVAGGPPSTERHQPRSSLAEERAANVSRTSLPALLRYEDRNSMAFSVEARTPFLDYRLVELAMALPAEALIWNGRTKAILRDATLGLIPETVRLRGDKLGFATPERRWLGELTLEVRDLLGPSSSVAALLRPAATAAIDRDPALASRPGLFRLVSLELWLRYVRGFGSSHAISL